MPKPSISLPNETDIIRYIHSNDYGETVYSYWKIIYEKIHIKKLYEIFCETKKQNPTIPSIENESMKSNKIDEIKESNIEEQTQDKLFSKILIL